MSIGSNDKQAYRRLYNDILLDRLTSERVAPLTRSERFGSRILLGLAVGKNSALNVVVFDSEQLAKMLATAWRLRGRI
jgi:hypothetical protein